MESSKPHLLKLKAYSTDILESTMPLLGTRMRMKTVETMTSTTEESSLRANPWVCMACSTTRGTNRMKVWLSPLQL